ncbi:MAG TPA: ABC transporter permease [Gemmatimonadaceae bacterium]|nr:ABC transporter permease [Gemmatimonadaceae bacterium]
MFGVRRVFRLSTLGRRDVDRDVDEEIAFHLAMREAALRANGLSPGDASQAAKVRFGNVEGVRDACVREARTHTRSERLMQLLDEARQDARFAIRSLMRARGFAAAVIATVALGVGANATVFSLTSAVVLRPITGVRDADQLFELREVMSYPGYRDLRERLAALRLAGLRERRIALGNGAAAEHTLGGVVSGNFFEVAGIGATLGRTLNPVDDVAGAPPVGVLAHDYWTRALGADSAVIGRTMTVNGTLLTVVGVAARDFRGLHLGAAPVIWVPIHAWPAIAPPMNRTMVLDNPNWEWLSVVGRLAPGSTMAQTHSAVATAMSVLAPGLPRFELDRRAEPRPIQAAALASGARDAVVRFVVILAGVVALVLLTACANIAGLLLTRAAYREREIAVRIALGAGRGRLVRQLLTESLVVAAGGGVAGVLLFLAVRSVIGGITFPGGIEGKSLGLALDGRLVTFAALLTLLTGLLVGLIPALQASHPDTAGAMKDSGAQRGSRRQTLRGVLVTAQVAIGIVLLIGTGLFARALTRAFAVDLGFPSGQLLTMSVDPGLARFSPQRAAAYYKAVTERVAAVPGVRGVTWTVTTPLGSDQDRGSATVEGYTPAPDERVMFEFNPVGPRYHEVMGINMVSGRGFDERDGLGGQHVMVINETAAKRYFAGRSAVGAYVTMGDTPSLVIGVARDAKYHELNESPRPYAYFPMLQEAGKTVGAATLVVRAAIDPARLLPAAVEAARAAEPAVPVFAAATLPDRLRFILAPQLAGAWLLGVFSLLALVVAAVGIYGIVAYAVSQRTREIGIRMALGARASSVVGLVVGGNLRFVALGIPIGLVLAVLLARGMSRFLYGVEAMDALTLAGTSALMLTVGLIASYIPARRAVRVDPLLALRTAAVCLLCLGTARGAASQATTVVTPATLAARGLPIRSDTVDGFVGDKEQRNFYGFHVYAVARTTVGGRGAYLVSMNYVASGREKLFQSDTLAVDAASLAPLWHRSHAKVDVAAVTFAAGHATGSAQREHESRVTVDHQLSEGAFDSNLVRWILPMLPLAPGYQARITSFSIWRNAEVTTTLTVTGEESVRVGDRKIDTWVVASSAGPRRWIAKSTGEVVQEHTPSGAGGQGFWEVKR